MDGSASWPDGTFMSRLGDGERAHLMTLGDRFGYPPGTRLIQQWRDDTYVYLLIPQRPGTPSCVKVTASAENGGRSLLGFRGCGDVVGELASLFGLPRTATVTTCTPVVARKIPGLQFKEFMADRPAVWKVMGRSIADLLVWGNDRRLEFAEYSVAKRLARAVVDVFERYGTRTPDEYRLDFRVSQGEWGQLVGAGHNSVNQALRSFERLGYIERRSHRFFVTDHQGLREYAELA